VNRYRHLKLPEKITLTSRDPVNLPVTSPVFLALHATCAKIAQFSGVDAYTKDFDENEEDVEDLGVLVGGGRSADVLANALMRSMSIAHVAAGNRAETLYITVIELIRKFMYGVFRAL
jgi:hypothetical protein